MQNGNTDHRMAQYLLGELSDEESAQIEREYLADRDFFDELLAVEDDLLDEYARGELEGRQREQFERRWLATPGQKERLRYAQILTARVNALPLPVSPEKKRPEKSSGLLFFNRHRLALPLAFASLLLLIVAGWLLVRTTRLQQQVERMRAEQVAAERREQELREQLAGEMKAKEDLLGQLQQKQGDSGASGQSEGEPSDNRVEPRIATFTLATALMRGGEANSFVLPRHVETVQLDIPLVDATYRSYRAEVQTADGEPVYQQSGLTVRRTPGGKVIRLKFPIRLRRARDYTVKVSGRAARGDFEDAGLYSFRISQK